MQIDLDTAKTTEQAAAELGVTPSQLRGTIAKYGCEVPKFGNTLIFTKEAIDVLRTLLDRVKDGGCPKCGWKPPSKAAETSPAPETTEDTSDA